jgi:uncharacterized protein (TIGR01777 family)
MQSILSVVISVCYHLNMRYLITGGSGFIGRALCRALLTDGQEVTVLTRDAPRAGVCLPRGVRLVTGLDQAPAADAVINLAGENLAQGRWSAARKQALRDSRIGTTQALLTWIAAQLVRPRVLVSGSAIGWYGSRGDKTLSEDAAPGRGFAARLCRAWEDEATKAQALGIRVCRIRTGIVLGTEDGALKKMLLPFRLGLGGRMGDGRQWMSWIALEDVVALIRWLVQNEQAAGAYNATAPTPVMNAEFTAALGRALHRPAWLPAPAFALRLLLGEMAELLLTGQRVLPTRALREGFVFRYATLPAAFKSIFAR